MKTLYIDVYFLINFTVDILALYFAALFSKMPTNAKRLILSSLFGAIISVIVVFLPEIAILKLVFSALGLLLIGYITPRKVSFQRRIKYIFSFIGIYGFPSYPIISILHFRKKWLTNC